MNFDWRRKRECKSYLVPLLMILNQIILNVSYLKTTKKTQFYNMFRMSMNEFYQTIKQTDLSIFILLVHEAISI